MRSLPCRPVSALLAQGLKYFMKQGMQLASKMRFPAVQMEALLTDDLWLANATQANRLDTMLAEALGGLPE